MPRRLPGEAAAPARGEHECRACGEWKRRGERCPACAADGEPAREPYRGDWRRGARWPINRIDPKGSAVVT